MFTAASKFVSRYRGNIIRSIVVGAANFLSYRRGKKPIFGPLYVGWNLTFRCNCGCSFCRSSSFDSGNELNPEECINIVKSLGANKVSLLTLTGGEPLLRKDLYEIIKEAKKYGINVNINTNGSLLESQAEEILDCGVDALTVSVDSASASTHDSLRQYDGLFAKAEKGIAKIKLSRKKGKPRLLLGVTISAKNFNELDKIIEYWQEKVDEIVFQPIHDDVKSSIFKVSDKGMLFSDDQKGEFLKCFEHAKNKYGYFKDGYESEFPNYFFNKTTLCHKYKCFAGSFILQIDAQGNVYPCPDFVETVGNLRDEDFRAVWTGERMRRFRAGLKKERRCFCWHRCTGALNYHLTKLAGYEEDDKTTSV